jgi:hypothetical protein
VVQVSQNPPGNSTTDFFGYDDGYFIADTILPGKAYWVKNSTAGAYVLDPSAPVIPAKAATGAATDEFLSGLNKLIVSPPADRRGSYSDSHGLYFGTPPPGGVRMERFELPPVPPPGIFDARFSSQSRVALIPEHQDREFELPLRVQGSENTAELSWVINTNEVRHFGVVGRVGATEVVRRAIDGSGSMTLDLTGGVQYSLMLESVPEKFALDQNFPNPFNPATSIRFDLPVGTRVNLEVYNTVGQLVTTLVAGEEMAAGTHTVTFTTGDLPSGMYIYKIQAGSFSGMKKMLLVK